MVGAAWPLVSVITPSLNQGRFIEETICSVESQDYPRLEHVVVDGGSTDETLQILRRHERLVWRSEADRGQSDALNKGIGLARGEILGWLNADDTYLPGAARAAVVHLRDHPDVDLVYGNCCVVDETGRVVHVIRPGRYDLRKLLTFEQAIPQPTVFFRRRVVEQIGGLDPTLEMAMDYDFCVRAGRRARIAYVPAIGATIREHPATKSSVRFRDVLPEILGTLERTFAEPGLPGSIAALRREAFSAAYIADGIRAYHAGDRGRARALLWTGLRRYPHPLRARTPKALLFLGDTLIGTRMGARLRRLVQRVRRRHPGGASGDVPAGR